MEKKLSDLKEKLFVKFISKLRLGKINKIELSTMIITFNQAKKYFHIKYKKDYKLTNLIYNFLNII